MIIPLDLYSKIQKSMPIPCVDLLVVDENGDILLLKRANEPAKGHWWFPGGRVHYLEPRHDAAVRKLGEECGLKANIIQELGTFDVMLENPITSTIVHGITTLFLMKKLTNNSLKIDNQSSDYRWISIKMLDQYNLDNFVKVSIFSFIENYAII